ncbi:MAG: hypothetical protein K0Q55_3919 [Verrucomicrobia bacterium]|nr:hypothetical protein [Verrucomicrobiota bacterium]
MPGIPKYFQWFEPREVFRPRLKAEFATVWKNYRLARIIPVSLLFAALTIVVLIRLGEPIDFSLCLRMTCALAVVLAGPWIVYGMLLWIPPSISLSSKGLCIQHGNGTFWVVKDKITSIELDLTQFPGSFLTVQSHQLKKMVGLGRQIDPTALLTALREWFPGIPIQCFSPVLPVQKPHSTTTPNNFAPQDPNTTVALNHMNAR